MLTLIGGVVIAIQMSEVVIGMGVFGSAVGVHWLLYRFAAQAAERVATFARASLDLHYLDLLRQLGARGDVQEASRELRDFWERGVGPPGLTDLSPEPVVT